MKCLAGLLAAFFVLAGIGASDAAIRIAQDAGGRIETYVGKYQGVRSSGERVIIDGSCVSACTIVLGTVPHDRICVTPCQARISCRLGSRCQRAQDNQPPGNADAVFDVSIRGPALDRPARRADAAHDFPERPRARGHVSPLLSGFAGLFALKPCLGSAPLST